MANTYRYLKIVNNQLYIFLKSMHFILTLKYPKINNIIQLIYSITIIDKI